MNKCNYCRKVIFFFPVILQGKLTKYHRKCFDEYAGNMLEMAMIRALRTGEGMLIPI